MKEESESLKKKKKSKVKSEKEVEIKDAAFMRDERLLLSPKHRSVIRVLRGKESESI